MTHTPKGRMKVRLVQIRLREPALKSMIKVELLSRKAEAGDPTQPGG
jgi:hypothetical protein